VRIGLYARVSSGSDEQANALEQQRSRLEAAAAAQGCTAPAWYVDVASGSKDDRPELQRLLSDCQGNRLNAVIVTRLDRLSRSSAHGAQLLRFFQQDTAPNLLALDDSLDLSTPGGRFMARLLISWAEAESDRLSERVKHGAAYRRSKLYPLGRQAPYGYAFNADRTNIEPDPDSWPIAQALVAHFLETGNVGATVALSRDVYGVVWGSNFSLRRWLCNPSLTGARVYGGSKRIVDAEGKKRRIDNPPGTFTEVHPGTHEALITVAQHAQILAVFHANALPERRQLLPGRVRVCTGLVECEHCGHNLISRTVMTKQPYIQLRCQHPGCEVRTRNCIKEDAVVMAFLAAVMTTAERLAGNLDELQAVQDGALSPEAQQLLADIKTLEQISGTEELIKQKRAELELLSVGGHGIRNEFLQQAEAFRNPAVLLKVAADDPAGMRLLFQRYFRAVVGDGRVKGVRADRALRLPGEPELIPVTPDALAQG
jgi:DNA invertase Pin-like site-specific DNA recombinase